MQKYILFLDENFSSHPKKDLCIRILTLLSYVETNQEAVIEAFNRGHSLFRHPNNHLAIHIGQYESAQQLKDYLNALLGEVHGCFRSLIEHHAQYRDSKIVHCFLSNIEDSSTGCMEFRLRRALTFASLSFSQGFAVESLDSVMETAKKVSRDSVIEDILDLFAEKIEYHYPIQLKNDRVPLSWPLVLDYFRTIFLWDEINSDWAKFGEKNFPVFECQEKWVFYYFADSIAAKRYLSYIKATLPHSETEYFQNWFKSLPLEQKFKFGAYEFYKVDNKTVEINKGLSGFQVQASQLKPEVRFTVYLNCNADTILNGDDVEQKRKNNLLHPLKVLYKILVQNYANKKLIEAVIDSDFNFSEVQRALKNGADPDAPLSLMSPTLSLKYPTLLHYICLSPGLIQKDQCRRIALELIYWGAKAAKDVASDQIKQVNAVLDIVNKTIENAPLTYSRVRDVLALFIKILMENYVDSGSWLSPRLHKVEASLIEVGGVVCCGGGVMYSGIVVGSLGDMMALIKKYHASEAIDKTGTFHGLLDFILDPVKLYSAVHAHAKAHPRNYKIEILPFPTALLKKEGMSPLSEFDYTTEVQDEENKSERSLFKSLLG